ncbi:hypothetical protein [Bacillus thuringiensis]|uniref:Uncharacterized protein n=1 Tax=Bacillus thuringiensis DB27 TaxID=1431339 RepID=W8YDC2_BACTU|nr:hypothetical protein [Bacillus thuringiensis]CDN39524.1 unnamed protein product [Bacillus thuringiensis DB27]
MEIIHQSSYLITMTGMMSSTSCVTSMSVANEIKRKETGKGMFEELFPEVKTYTLYEMNRKKYLQNNQTGEINTVKNLDQDI